MMEVETSLACLAEEGVTSSLNMYLFPMGHPSGRHSGDACNFDPACKDSANSVDWSNPDLEKYPKFKDLQVNEVLLSAGDFMYLPTHWFHYIISVGLN
eukprot:CAMPEP_0114370546 /NCGR_PEP_ID=MMETSP0101-20121206/32586_1 /TAXON_ID=38822 ORGANISM="Pteridomonas danica, Strain PT" /NCGR_SAMPLE_ID=MMETSP0101 /ASSEMBLY_ACC=CAM_ASM_000211 /LENGTH=97 /DNA_ID=CAMNT_0001522119 /DNA_START=480 /DNA_END=770 /DNA_ORIENTATION=+